MTGAVRGMTVALALATLAAAGNGAANPGAAPVAAAGFPRTALLGGAALIVGLGATLLWLRRDNRRLARRAAAAEARAGRLASLVGNVPCAFYRYTLNAGQPTSYLSPQIEAVTGYPPEDFLQGRRRLASLIHPDDAARVAREQRAQIDGGHSYALEYRILDAAGNVRWLLDHGQAGPAADAGVPTLDGVLLDISDQRVAEEELRQAAVVFDNTTQGIIVTDAGGRILRVNRALGEISGYSEGELIGNDPAMLGSGRHDAAFFADMWRSLGKLGYWQGEIWNRRKSGEIYPTWQSISVLHGASGETAGYISLYTDISPFKQHEEQLQRLAYHDPLTGLPNRILFDERLDHAIDRAARRGERLAVLYLDLDKFKEINDHLGHQVGDELLEAIGRRLSLRLRKSDTLSRRGGDEFTLLIDAFEDIGDIRAIAGEVLEQMAKPFALPSGHSLSSGCSIGISLFPEDAAEAATLIRCADAAMYRAKDEGGQRFRFYSAEGGPD